VRIISMERQDRISGLQALGVDVIRWRTHDGLSPESQLSVHARLARRQR
jgi:hypothetical protein